MDLEEQKTDEERKPREELGPKHWINGPNRTWFGTWWIPSRTYDDRGPRHLVLTYFLIAAFLCLLAFALNFGWLRLLF